MNLKTLLAILLLFGAAAWVVFAPAEFKYTFYLAVWHYLPGIALVVLGGAIALKRS